MPAEPKLYDCGADPGPLGVNVRPVAVPVALNEPLKVPVKVSVMVAVGSFCGVMATAMLTGSLNEPTATGEVLTSVKLVRLI